MKKVKGEKRKSKDDVILLKDLAPHKDVKGGAGKIIFGQGGNPFLGTARSEDKKDKPGSTKKP